jgi:hypothetical protein
VTGVCWVRDLRARNAGPSLAASVDAVSLARADVAVTPVRGPLSPDASPLPVGR